MFKTIYYWCILAVISLFSSCTNLDEEIFSSIPEKDFYKTESEFLAAMVPIYSSMRTLTEHSNWWDLEETTDVCVTPVKIMAYGMMEVFIFAYTNILGWKKMHI